MAGLTMHPSQRILFMAALTAMLAAAGCSLDMTKSKDAGELPAPGEPAIAWASNRAGDFDLYLAAPDGSAERRLTDHKGFDGQPSWSPDGTRLAFASERTGNSKIFVLDLTDGTRRQLTHRAAADADPAWSPDGSTIVFTSERDGDTELYTIPAAGGTARRLTNRPGLDQHPAWIPDGSGLLFSSDRSGQLAVYAMDAVYALDPGAGQATTRLVADGEAEVGDAAASVTGWLAYVTAGKGDDNHDIFRRPLADVDQTPVSVTYNTAEDGMGLSWSADGDELAFVSNRAGNYEIYTVEVFPRQLATLEADDELLWSPDGRHMAVLPRAGGDLRLADSTGVPMHLQGDVVAGTPRWSRDSARIAYVSTETGEPRLYLADAVGSQILDVHAASESPGAGPTWSAGGGRLAFAVDTPAGTDTDIAWIVADSLGRAAVDTVARATAQAGPMPWPRWAPDTDRVAYLADGAGGTSGTGLYIAGLDPSRVAFADSGLVGPIEVGPIDGAVALEWSPLGSRLFALTGDVDVAELTIVEGDGEVRTFADYPVSGRPTWTGDTGLLFVSARTGDDEVYWLRLPDGEPVNLSNHPGADTAPAYSATLTAVAFASDRDGAGDLYAVPVTGGAVTRLTGDGMPVRAPHWDPTAEGVVYLREAAGTTLQLRSSPRRLTNNSSHDWFPAWSPALE